MIRVQRSSRSDGFSSRPLCALLLALSAVAVSGCGGGDDGGETASSAEATSPEAGTTTDSGNQAPKISGTAPTAISAGMVYNFTPTASDADGDALTFSIQNKPSWANFTAATGKLTGTPTAGEVGTYSNVAISVSDGKATAVLGTFSVAVNAISDGRVTLSWTAPTENTDGTPLTDLSGYKIHYGTSAGTLDQTVEVSTLGISSYVVENLAPATWYFAVTAVTSSGLESSLSNVANKKI